MRFKKGDKVEVMNNKGVPYLWHPAEILFGTGHTYHVRYDCYPAVGIDRLVDIVSRKLVRPLPPLVQLDLESYNAEDIVEAFYKNSWTVAVIVKILGGKQEKKRKTASLKNRYLLRLLGYSQEVVVDRLNIRMRQTWDGGRWFLVGKISHVGNDLMSRNQSTSSGCRKMKFQDGAAYQNSPLVSAASRKRASPYDSSIIEANNGPAQKLRATVKEGQKQRVVAAPYIEKVDAAAYPFSGGKSMHSYFTVISNGYDQADRAKQNEVGYSLVSSSELSSSDSEGSSVGSCSLNNEPLKNSSGHFIPGSFKESETLCSDAESSSCPGFESSSHPSKEDVAISIHRLELHAYRSTMEALYASGSLSWDQEELLTDLRIMLHISNDEHLKELKHLIST
ncbi:uncharacterized protein LOC127250371 isoform X2 [Andrographis paniculata]|uniref:uncharacterized protein LOC127250371 isoform X2 n=1 Tax=Andrographis paniculata TaxID=175694 RepID=UPI0021E74451|nr:uncharacterized protein LOC127250371 isoform X2 [Andrographis paniculata]